MPRDDPLGRRCALRAGAAGWPRVSAVDAIGGALRPGLERRLGPDPAIGGRRLGQRLRGRSGVDRDRAAGAARRRGRVGTADRHRACAVATGGAGGAPAAELLQRLALLEQRLGAPRARGEALEIGAQRFQHLAPAAERALGVDRDQDRLRLGDRSLGDPAAPLERAGGVTPPQPAARGVVGVVGRELGIAGVEVLEQRARVGPLRLVGLGQRQQVARRAPLGRRLGQRLHRLGEAGLGRRPVLGAEALGRLLARARS